MINHRLSVPPSAPIVTPMLNAPFWPATAINAAWRRLAARLARVRAEPGYETLRGW